jgi:uncharacterized protein YndB with AHSA1/START domain
MKTIKKTATVNASAENVWKVLVEDHYNRDWFSEFGEGTHAIGEWKQNGKIIFKDPKGFGLIGKIVRYEPYRFIDIEYTGILNKGEEDYSHPDAIAMKGAHETYTLSGSGTTLLQITSDMSEEFIDTMSGHWDKALVKVKKLAEHL